MNSYEKAMNYLKNFRTRFNIDENPIKNIISLMQSKDYILVLRFPNSLGVSGMTIKKKDRDKEYRCIYLNTNEPLGRQYFTFAHELYHTYYEPASSGVCLQKEMKTNEIEIAAETFASNLLIPRVWLLVYLKQLGLRNYKDITKEQVFFLQKKFNVTFQAIIFAIDNLKCKPEYSKYIKFVPNVTSDLKKYYKNDWDRLEDLTVMNDNNNNLNSSESIFDFPDEFKNNLVNNYKRGLIEIEDLESIFDFFEKNDELKCLIK